MLKNIVFDIGNVLIDYQPKKFLKARYGENNLADQLFRFVYAGPEWVELDRGSITLCDAADSICRKSGLPFDTVFDALFNWVTEAGEITGTTGLLPKFEEKGFHLYYLSNFHNAASRYIFEKYRFFKLFSGGIFSCDVKLLKPDPTIYRALSKKYGLEPTETLFVDDTAGNVKAAEKLGWYGHPFQNAHELNDYVNTLARN